MGDGAQFYLADFRHIFAFFNHLHKAGSGKMRMMILNRLLMKQQNVELSKNRNERIRAKSRTESRSIRCSSV